MQNASEKANLELQKQNEILKQTIADTKEKLQTSEEEIKYLQFQLAQIKRMMFGAKRERFISNIEVNQLELPFEVEEKPVIEKTSEQEISYKRQKAKKSNHPGRLEFPSHLPVEEVIIEPEESTKGLKCIGQEVTSELEYEPARFFVRKYIRNKYAFSNGEGILIGKLPSRPIEKGIPGPGLLANIMVEKFVDHLPFYRQRERFKRAGITNISTSSIDSWTASTAMLIEPLYDYLKRFVLEQGYLQVDETPIKVLDKNKKGTTHQGYHWVYNAPLQNAVFYDYRQGRGREGPMQLLKNFKGYLQTDGYSVYDWFAKQPGITHVGCMAHARRYFEKALSYDAQKAGLIMQKIQDLYGIERKAKDAGMSSEQRKELRLSESLPLINELGKLIATMRKTAVPKSPMGVALDYTIKRWDSLINYLYDGSIEIDNNRVENSIRPNALGRKNYLFAGSHEGAKRAAMFYTFFGTCKKNNVNPYQWLKKVLEIIPDYPANKIQELFPQNLKL